MSGDRRTRLPLWAQSELVRLEQKVAALQEALDERDGGAGDTDTVVVDWGAADRTMPLRKGARIGFFAESRPVALAVEDYPDFLVDVLDGGLQVQGTSRIVVEPRASNDVTIRILR